MRVAISMHSEEPVRAYQGQSIVDEAHMCPRVQHQVLRLKITPEHPMRMHECANTQKTSEATKRIGMGGRCPSTDILAGTGGNMAPRWHRRMYILAGTD